MVNWVDLSSEANNPRTCGEALGHDAGAGDGGDPPDSPRRPLSPGVLWCASPYPYGQPRVRVWQQVHSWLEAGDQRIRETEGLGQGVARVTTVGTLVGLGTRMRSGHGREDGCKLPRAGSRLDEAWLLDKVKDGGDTQPK